MVRRSRRAAMTLIEVLISLCIVTVGMLGALAMLGTLFRGTTYSRNISDGMALLQSKVEAEVSRASISLAYPTNSAFTPESPETLDSLGSTAGAGPFLYTRNTYWTTSPDGLRRHVQVTVAFVDGSNVTHTLIAERDRNLP